MRKCDAKRFGATDCFLANLRLSRKDRGMLACRVPVRVRGRFLASRHGIFDSGERFLHLRLARTAEMMSPGASLGRAEWPSQDFLHGRGYPALKCLR